MPTATPLLSRLTAAAPFPASVRADDARPVAVMIIGADPRAAGVPAPARKVALPRMTEALARFRPTVVAVEWPAALVAERFARYLTGTLTLSSSEVVKLGFQLAKRTGARIAGVGQPGEIPCAGSVCAALAAAGRPGDRMVVLQETPLVAALRQRVMTTPGLKLVEANAWLGL